MPGEQAMPLQEARTKAVLESLQRIREIATSSVTRERLEQIKSIVTRLAERSELFPREQFPLGPNGAARVFSLGQDPDGAFAIYASAGAPGKSQPPHNHTTWAAISGVYGDEHNVLYKRADDGSNPGEGRLERVGELTVRRGGAVGLMPDDFHTIRVTSNDYSLHLHAYGRSLEQLPERIRFEGPEGGRFRTFPANSNITSPRISAAELKALAGSPFEFALLDVRDEEPHSHGHPLFACSVPLEHFEARIVKLVPRKTACVVLFDAGGGEVETAAGVLRKLGYKNVSILDGGIAAWNAAGFETFSGFNVPSKAFGEVVERHYATPHITSVELRRLLDDERPVIILDSRTQEEFVKMNVPTALSCPGAELVYRVFDAVQNPDTLVVVNCAGRTRSILGAQSLIDAGLQNRVVALHNGTMGWQLAGFSLEHGTTRQVPEPSTEGLARARTASTRVAERCGLRTIGLSEFGALQQAVETKTLYLFDVRSPEEYREGHLPGARCAPGGQLVQATDIYVGVRHARIVVFDSDGVRARMTGSWLLQMGAGDICVLEDPRLATLLTEKGNEPGWMPDFGSSRHKPYGSPEAMESYLYWEVALVEQIRRDGDAPFLSLLSS